MPMCGGRRDANAGTALAVRLTVELGRHRLPNMVSTLFTYLFT